LFFFFLSIFLIFYFIKLFFALIATFVSPLFLKEEAEYKTLLDILDQILGRVTDAVYVFLYLSQNSFEGMGGPDKIEQENRSKYPQNNKTDR